MNKPVSEADAVADAAADTRKDTQAHSGSEEHDSLLLQDQLCFALYSTSRAITKQYSKLLTELGLTYPQYLAMLVLWEGDGLAIQTLATTLELEGATTTPLVQRLEKLGLVTRERSQKDERRVQVFLTPAGRNLQRRAMHVPEAIGAAVGVDKETARQLIHAVNRIKKTLQTRD